MTAASRLGGLAALALAGLAPGMVRAQELGSYQGTIEFSGTQSGPAVTYRARLRLILPVTSRTDSQLTAEFLAGEAPDGKLDLFEWEEHDRQKSADSDGQFSSYRCSLAAPVTVPVSVTGVIDIDLDERMHDFSITVLSLRDVELDCVHSRSGAYKETKGMALTTGTGVPGSQYETKLPFASPARLTGQFTLDPTDYTDGSFGPIQQKWDFQLTR